MSVEIDRDIAQLFALMRDALAEADRRDRTDAILSTK